MIVHIWRHPKPIAAKDLCFGQTDLAVDRRKLKRLANRIDRFAKVLIEKGYIVTVRKTRGDDIDAACGQLVGDVIDRTKRILKKQQAQRGGSGIDVKIS